MVLRKFGGGSLPLRRQRPLVLAPWSQLPDRGLFLSCTLGTILMPRVSLAAVRSLTSAPSGGPRCIALDPAALGSLSLRHARNYPNRLT